MEKDIKNIFEKANTVRLSTEEKRAMRDGVRTFMAEHPVIKNETKRHIQWKEFSLLGLILRPMPIILIIALLIGGGTSLAAESALPGDALYGVKVEVNEEVRSFVAFSSEAQARWEARRAERRLEEAERLAAEGRLDAETRAEIEARFEEHAEDFEEETRKGRDSETSLELSAEFEAFLKAHEEVLIEIANTEAESRAEVESLLLEVRSTLNAAVEMRIEAEAEIESETEIENETEVEDNEDSDLDKNEAEAESETEVESEGRIEVEVGL